MLRWLECEVIFECLRRPCRLESEPAHSEDREQLSHHSRSARGFFPINARHNANMNKWPDRRLLNLLNIAIPIQAPMAGSESVALAPGVSSTVAVGSLACAVLSPAEIRDAIRRLRDGMERPFNLISFCHRMEPPDAADFERWKSLLRPHYTKWGLDIETVSETRLRLIERTFGKGGIENRPAVAESGEPSLLNA
jgi:hypothetical protein